MTKQEHSFAINQVVLAEYCKLARDHAPVVFTINTDDLVAYEADTPDVSKYATNPDITPGVALRNFNMATILADVVSVNGEPVKGLYASLGTTIATSPTPNPAQGGAIADSTHYSIRQNIFEILKADGTPIGTILTQGLYGGNTPGLPSGVTGDWAVVGGTGAFLGIRGQMGNRANPVAPRIASVLEEPANRRVNGGGTSVWVLTLIPMFIPKILATHLGPAVHSSDSHLVSASKPISAGEVVAVFMTGLGPTQPGVDPGQPFPETPAEVVNSPITVQVNGKDSDVLEAVGVPGSIDCYRVSFRIPRDTTRGLATVQVTAAWIPGTRFSISIR